MSKINAAESIRGLACMAVVFSHLSLTFYPFLHNFEKSKTSGSYFLDWLHHSPFGFFFSGTGAVFVFFVLSGYVLTYAILSKESVITKIESMALRRYPRLAIPALISCVIAYLATLAPIDTSHLIGNWLQRYGSTNPTFLNAIYEGLIGSFIFADAKINWVLWSMQPELLGSFLLFVLLLIYTKYKKAFLILALLSPVLFIVISPGTILAMYSFVIGCLVYLYGKKIPTTLAVIMLLFGLYCAGYHDTSAPYQIFADIFHKRAYSLLNFFAGIFIVIPILLNTKLSNTLNKQPLVKLGELSFSIYLIHIPMLYLICVPIYNLMLKTTQNYNLSALLASTLFIATVLIFASFYSKYVDQLAIKIAAKIENTFRTSLKKKP